MFESMYHFGKEKFLRAREGTSSLALLGHAVAILMGLYVFLNPFPHMTAIKQICFYLSLFLVCLLLIFKKIDFSFRTPLLIPFCLFTCWVFYGLFFAVDKGNSIHDFHAHLLRYIVLYFILVNVFNSRKRFMALSRIIIASATLYSVLGIFYFYFILGNNWATRFSYGASKGLLGYEMSGNSFYVLVIFSILLTLSFLKKGEGRQNLALVFCCIPQIAIFFLIQSRGAYVALFFSLGVFLWRYKKILWAVLILLIVIIAISPIKNRFTIDYLIHADRIKVMFLTLEIVQDYPVIGIGFGNRTYGEKIDLKVYNNRVPSQYKQTKRIIVGSPHNMLLNILVRTGYLGLVLFLSILFVFSWMCWKCARDGGDDFARKWGLCMGSAFLALFISGMFDQMFHHFMEIILYTMLSMGTIIWRINKELSS